MKKGDSKVMWIIAMIVFILLFALAILFFYGKTGGFLSRWQIPLP